MLPWNLLDLRLRMINKDILSPIHVGIFPDNVFSCKCINLNLVQFHRDQGNSPEKLLLFNSNVISRVKEPKELGISPNKLLWAKFRIYSSCQCLKQSEISSDRWLLERSRCLNIPPVIEHIKEFYPENLFLERFNEVKFEEIIGRGLSNLFELKSSRIRFLNLVDIFGNLPLIWL